MVLNDSPTPPIFKNELNNIIDSSLTHHDSQPFFVPRNPPIQPLDFERPASDWMHPLAQSGSTTALVGIPCNWYMEDATPLQYYPHMPNSHGYVDVRNIEQMWKDRFLWLWENSMSEGAGNFVFPIVLHPDTSGMSHVIGMIERFLRIYFKHLEGSTKRRQAVNVGGDMFVS